MAPPPPSPPHPPLAPGKSLRYRVTIENTVSANVIDTATWNQLWEAAYTPWPTGDKHAISSRPTSKFVDNPNTPGTQPEGTIETIIETNSRVQWNLIIKSWTGGDFPPCTCEEFLGLSAENCKYIPADLIAKDCMFKKISYTDEEGHDVFYTTGLDKVESDYFQVADSSDESSDES